MRLKDICQLIDGENRNGKGIYLDAKFLRGKSSASIVEQGKFVYAGDNIILVDGENSGEVFSVPQDGYMGSTYGKHIQTVMVFFSHVETIYLSFHSVLQRVVEKFKKRCGNSTPQ